MQIKTSKVKQTYVAPHLMTIRLKMESGIAAGSITISPTSTTGEIRDEWDEQTDERTITW
ncbi:hypothetical protein ACR78V_19725 [Sphingobacterium multivorum]|uniref:hypothetical protein n=1 Tax=Sphingobacterium multivorum TaxID=28454 RepID=UPI003DA5D711